MNTVNTVNTGRCDTRNQGPVVVALGGNALQSGEHLLDYPDLPPACHVLAGIADSGLVITHGNGPQIGMLAADMTEASYRPLDVLGAETEGMLGYAIEQTLDNALAHDRPLSTLLTRTEVDADDPATDDPVKPVGHWLDAGEADRLRQQRGWQFREDKGRYRRLVPSPRPLRTLQLGAVQTLIDAGVVVICAGGGGIPVARDSKGRYQAVEGVIDKDLTTALLARELDARLLVLATDVDGVYRDFGTDSARLISETNPDALSAMALPAGSMQPKAEAAAAFTRATGAPSVIGPLAQLQALIDLQAGTRILQQEP